MMASSRSRTLATAARVASSSGPVGKARHRQPVELAAHHVHGAEHQVLRHADADVHLADPLAVLPVGVVPRAEQQGVEPGHQGDLEPAHLALAALQDAGGLVVVQDAGVEGLGDRLERRGRQRVEGAQPALVVLAELDVALQLVEDRRRHGPADSLSTGAVTGASPESTGAASGR